MRQITITQGAAGTSKWAFLDNRRLGTEFNTSLAVLLSFGSTLTYDVETTYDKNTKRRWKDCSISRTTTTATVTLVDHGLATGDSAIIFDSNYTTHAPESNFEGAQDVTVVDADTFSYTVADTGGAAAIARIITFRVFKHPTLNGDTASQAGVLEFPTEACRLNITAYTDGDAELTLFQQGS